MMRRCGVLGVGEGVLEVQDYQVAGAYSQIGRLMAGGVGVAVERGAVGGWGVLGGEFGFEDAVLAAQVLGFFYYAAGLRAWAWILCGCDLGAGGEEECRDPSEIVHACFGSETPVSWCSLRHSG